MQTKWVKQGGAFIPGEYLEETAAHAAEVEMMVALRDELDSYNKELKQIDPDLELVWAPENVTAPGLSPGRFHVLRRNPPPAPPLLIPLEHEDGSFREPGSWMYDMLRKADLWNDRAQADRKRVQEEITRQRAKRKQEEREETAWEIDSRLKSVNDTSVWMGGKDWKASTKGRR